MKYLNQWLMDQEGFDTGYYLAENQPEFLKLLLKIGESQKYGTLNDWKVFDQLIEKDKFYKELHTYRKEVKYCCLSSYYRKGLKEGKKALQYQLNRIIDFEKTERRKEKLAHIEKVEKNEKER